MTEAVDDDVPRAQVGERVWIYEGHWQRPSGPGAELVAFPTERTVRLPDGVSFVEGACLGITAHRCGFADGPVDGQKVLVTGGPGVVGFYAIQFTQRCGATWSNTAAASAAS